MRDINYIFMYIYFFYLRFSNLFEYTHEKYLEYPEKLIITWKNSIDIL